MAATVVNSGAIDGYVGFALGGAVVRNSGDISGNVYFSGNDNTYSGAAGVADGVVYCAGSTVTMSAAPRPTFSISASDLSVNDLITGGGSAYDTLDITGQGTISARDQIRERL